jgi:Flp pilus assembly protein TadG
MRTGAGGRAFWRDRRGVAALEFAISATPLLILLLGIVEIGWLLANQYALTRGVEQAARYAVVHGSQSAAPATTAEVSAVFYQAAAPILGAAPSGVTVTVSFIPDNSPGSTVMVSAQSSFTPFSGIVGIPALTLAAQASYTIQN